MDTYFLPLGIVGFAGEELIALKQAFDARGKIGQRLEFTHFVSGT